MDKMDIMVNFEQESFKQLREEYKVENIDIYENKNFVFSSSVEDTGESLIVRTFRY